MTPTTIPVLADPPAAPLTPPVASSLGRLAVAGADAPDSPQPELSPLQQQLLEGIKRV